MLSSKEKTACYTHVIDLHTLVILRRSDNVTSLDKINTVQSAIHCIMFPIIEKYLVHLYSKTVTELMNTFNTCVQALICALRR